MFNFGDYFLLRMEKYSERRFHTLIGRLGRPIWIQTDELQSTGKLGVEECGRGGALSAHQTKSLDLLMAQQSIMLKIIPKICGEEDTGFEDLFKSD